MQLNHDTAADMLFWSVGGCLLAYVLDASGLLEICNCNLSQMIAMIWILSFVGCLVFAELKIATTGKSVVITGCDSGFGHSLARRLNKMGFRVFAGCLNTGSHGATALKNLGSSTLHVLQLDVTKADQLEEAKKEIESFLKGGDKLWGLVNNAGVPGSGYCEWPTLERYKQTAEVNIFGTVAATRCFLPMIRKARGRIVNIGSMVGRVPQPFFTPYVITKYAIEGFSDCLRLEMKKWNVKVSIVEPGNFAKATGISREEIILKQEKELWEGMPDTLKEEYPLSRVQGTMQVLRAFRDAGPDDMGPVIDAMTNALTQRFPRARYLPMDLHTFVRIFVNTHVPEWMYDLLYGS